MPLEFLRYNFGLPHGGLYANIIAAVILAGVGWFWARAHERRAIHRHEVQMKRLDEIHEQVKEK